MTRLLTIARHLLSILILPATVTVVVPWLLLRGRVAGPQGAGAMALTGLGACVGAAGLALVAATVRQFATVGRGTLAPWDPPRRFVAVGLYRHARNPMITGVLLVLLGEAAGLRSVAVLEWAAVFFCLNAVYLPLVEEPGLERRFGDEYRAYRAAVPRWIPRLHPWHPAARPSA